MSHVVIIVLDIKSQGQPACHKEQKTCEEESINVCMNVMYNKKCVLCVMYCSVNRSCVPYIMLCCSLVHQLPRGQKDIG